MLSGEHFFWRIIINTRFANTGSLATSGKKHIIGIVDWPKKMYSVTSDILKMSKLWISIAIWKLFQNHLSFNYVDMWFILLKDNHMYTCDFFPILFLRDFFTDMGLEWSQDWIYASTLVKNVPGRRILH